MPKQKHILIADDEEFVQKIYSHQLKKAGFNVLQARNGEDALALAIDKRPGVILLDVIMPVMDGFRVLEELAHKKLLKVMSVIMFSNLTQAGDVAHALELGATEYLTKVETGVNEVIATILDISSLSPQRPQCSHLP